MGCSAAQAASRPSLSGLLRRSPEWFASEEAQRFASNILSFQSTHGGWPKNTDTFTQAYSGPKPPGTLAPTFDNGATLGELRFLARAHKAKPNAAFKNAFDRGFRYILEAQYANGGWPQTFPFRPTAYERYITFNDGAMIGVMSFLRECWTSDVYDFLEPDLKRQARMAFDKGIDCILHCQVRVGGTLTSWCAQHDEKDFSPRTARTYELPSLSGAESVGIVQLLMSLEQPREEVVKSVKAAVKWFEVAGLKGIKVVVVPDSKSPKGTDKRVVEEADALPMWARFYEIGTNRPIFCDRDGVPKRKLSEIGYERRNGYAWLGYWPAALLEKEYPAWLRRVAAKDAPRRSEGP